MVLLALTRVSDISSHILIWNILVESLGDCWCNHPSIHFLLLVLWGPISASWGEARLQPENVPTYSHSLLQCVSPYISGLTWMTRPSFWLSLACSETSRDLFQSCTEKKKHVVSVFFFYLWRLSSELVKTCVDLSDFLVSAVVYPAKWRAPQPLGRIRRQSLSFLAFYKL